ncbi:MAG: PqqD family protein [Acidobacteriota bacterium]
MISLTDCALIPQHVIIRPVADEAILLNLATERYYGLDNVAYSMWQQATRCPTLQDALAALLDEYEVEREQLWRDFQSLLEQLLQADLIEIVPSDQVSEAAPALTS